MKKFLFLLVFLPALAFGQVDLSTVKAALQRGDAEVLGTYLDNTVELAIMDEEGVYSKEQALQKMRRFLGQQKVSSFVEVNNGAARNAGAQYIIGNMTTGSGTYRVYLYLAVADGKAAIQECRFDRQ